MRATALAAACLASPALGQQQIAVHVGPQDGSQFGFTVAFAGDLDVDGSDDIVVGAIRYNTILEDAGAAFVLSGNDGAVLHSFFGSASGVLLGHSVDGGGDVDGDGTPDVVVGAPYSASYGEVYSGATGARLFREDPVSAACIYFNSQFGRSVAMLGDYDGDGRDDVAFGWWLDFLLLCNYPGGVGVFGYDPAAGSSLYHQKISSCGCDCMLEEGEAVAGVGDVNGDGFADLVRGIGQDELVPGSSDNTVVLHLGPDGTPLWTVPIDAPTKNNTLVHGEWLRGIGDASGDGIPDVAVAGRFASSYPDFGVHVYSGADGALLLDLGVVGTRVGGAGDVDGDGRADVLVGDETDSFLGPDSGVARVFSGRDGRVIASMYGLGPGHRFGASVAGGGDANGDGVDDLVVGATGGPGAPAGYVAVFSGGLPPPPAAYCTAKANSLGCLPAVGSSGTPETSGPDDFLVTCSNALPAHPGLFFWGSTGPASIPFLGGTLCVAPPLARTPVTPSVGAGGCSGTYQFAFTQAYMLSQGLAPGTRVNGQWWMRDPDQADGTGVTLSDGIELEIVE